MLEADPTQLQYPLPLGDFVVEGLLGQGGSGTVFAARWGHRSVALKVMRDAQLDQPSERTRFLAEARLLARINHPGVVRVLDCGELPDGRPFLAMERLDGVTLAQRLREGPLPLPQALSYFAQLADTVQALHDHGLIHRDVKPENVVLLTGGQHAVLLDLGIAKPVGAPDSTVTREGGVRGTPAYMAPERFFGAAATVQSDLYELAVVLHGMLTGQLPWPASTDPVDRLSPARPTAQGVPLPAAFEEELLRALAARAEQRPPSVRAFAERLAQSLSAPRPPARRTADLDTVAADALPPPAPAPGGRPSEATEPARRPGRRLPARLRAGLAVAAAVALLAAAVAAVLVWRSAALRRSRPSRTSLVRPDDPARLAWLVHPADTRLLVFLDGAALRRSPLFAFLREGLSGPATPPPLAALGALCGIDLLRDLEAVSVGTADDRASGGIEAMVRGRWTRAGVERCLDALDAAGGLGLKRSRRGALTRVALGSRALHLAWLDDRTFFLSTRPTADEAWLRDRLAGRGGAVTATALAAVRQRLPASATFWAAHRLSLAFLDKLLGATPAPPGMLLVGDATTTLTMRLELLYVGGQQSDAARRALERQAEELRRTPFIDALITRLEVTADGDVVQLRVFSDALHAELLVRAVARLVAEADWKKLTSG